MNCGARRLCHQSCISPLITLETSADGAPATGCFHRHGVPRASLTSALQHTLGGASPCFLFEGGSIAHQKKRNVVAAQFRRPMRLTLWTNSPSRVVGTLPA
jgi:hypothetical protein